MCKVRLTEANIVPPFRTPSSRGAICKLDLTKLDIATADYVGDYAQPNSASLLVYALRVTAKMTMSEYDDWTRRELPEKIPARSRDWRRRAGDAIYDFDDDPPTVHKDAFHTVANRKTDLGGRYALLSEHFYYFGGPPLELPEHLRPIIPTGRAHQSPKNDPWVEPFEAWITSEFEANKLYGMPRGMPRSPERVTIGRRPG